MVTLSEFKQNFTQIRNMGFVKSMRNGPTGIGYTLESLLGIAENNNTAPDIDGAELKAHRTEQKTMITLFTFNKKAWKMPPLDAVKKYGSLDSSGRQGLYYTMSLTPNSVGLFLYVTDKVISVQHISGEIIVEWQMVNLSNRFHQKIPALLFVSAFTEERGGVEYFNYYRAQLMKGTSPELLADQFKSENILVDLRLHDKGTMARNHGTGFRTFEDRLPFLFKNVTDV